MRKGYIEASLRSWVSFTSQLGEFTPEELDYALQYEYDNERRYSVLNRLIRRKVEVVRQNELKRLTKEFLHAT